MLTHCPPRYRCAAIDCWQSSAAPSHPPPGRGAAGALFGWPLAGAEWWCCGNGGQLRPMHPQLRPGMQPPPPTGTTGSAPPPPVGPPGAGGGSGISLGIALVADAPGVGELCSIPPKAAPYPTIKTNRPAPARSAISHLPVFVITLNCRRRAPDAHKRSTQARRVDAAGMGFAVQDIYQALANRLAGLRERGW